MGFVKEFKDFAMRGNVVDMAVGIIIGGAFGKIVSSLVADVVMPPLGWATGGMDFSEMKYVIRPEAEGVTEVAVGYGKFIQVTVDFVIVAFAIFLMVKAMNSLKKKEEAKPAPPPPAPPRGEVLLAEIRDLLAKRS